MRRMFKIAGFVALGLSTLGAAALPFTVGTRPFIGPRSRALTDRRFEATPGRAERGRYLATSVNGCFACQSSSLWDREGLPFLTAPNITPDRLTGAGTWTDDMLARAIREGIGHDGRTLFPVMPYSQYRSMSDEDLASLIVYLRTIPAVTRELPKSTIPFPVSRLINALPEPIAAPVPQPLQIAQPPRRTRRSHPRTDRDDLHTDHWRSDPSCPVESARSGESWPGCCRAGGSRCRRPYSS